MSTLPDTSPIPRMDHVWFPVTDRVSSPTSWRPNSTSRAHVSRGPPAPVWACSDMGARLRLLGGWAVCPPASHPPASSLSAAAPAQRRSATRKHVQSRGKTTSRPLPLPDCSQPPGGAPSASARRLPPPLRRRTTCEPSDNLAHGPRAGPVEPPGTRPRPCFRARTTRQRAKHLVVGPRTPLAYIVATPCQHFSPPSCPKPASLLLPNSFDLVNLTSVSI